MQVQVGLLATGLAAAGCEVTVAAGPGALDVDSIEVRRLPSLSGRSWARFTAALRSVVREVEPDVVHGHGLRLAPSLMAASRTRSLVTCHGLDPQRLGRASLLVRASRTRVAACGEGPRRLLASRGISSRVLDNAVPAMPAPLARTDVTARFGLDASHLLVVSPARLTPQKDPCTLVRAIARTSGISALLTGGGPLHGQVADEVARLGLEGRVHVAEWLDDARAILASADVLALSSVWEGQPTVVLEAMAAGVAVVATGCVGTADTVVDGVTALLAEPRDDVGLGTALQRATDPALRARLAGAARAAAVDHRVEVVTASHLAAYERLVEGRWP